jgi:peptidoglycan hydrolase-like protein with peptidoglycan-binding domain
VNGTTATTFSPHKPVERQAAATLIVRALDYKLKLAPLEGIDLIAADQIQPWTYAFKDRWMIADVHKWGVGNAFRLNLMLGDGAGWVYPFFNMTRAQGVALIARSFVNQLTAQAQLPEKVEAVGSYPALRDGSTGQLVGWVESRLASMSYPVGPVDGVYDYRTTTGVMAYQKVEGLSRDGVFGSQAWGRIRGAQKPSPRYSRSGSRTEIDLARQVLFQIQDNQVVKVVPISSGVSGMGTPRGSFRIQRKIPGWHESRLGLLYSPSYFYGGYAIHGSRSVPPYPASHGCVRTPMWLSDGLYGELYIGRAVDIYW